MMETLTSDDMAVLLHTQRNGRFNGGGAATASLAERGYLRNIGRPAWVPEDYFVLTDKGREFIAEFQNPNKLPMDLSMADAGSNP